MCLILSCPTLTPPHVVLGHEQLAGSQSCGGQGGAGSRVPPAPLTPPLPHRVSAASGPQILPQEEDYGFDMEEKNKAVVVKSVQRGSLAEVRPLGGAALAGAESGGHLSPVPQGRPARRILQCSSSLIAHGGATQSRAASCAFSGGTGAEPLGSGPSARCVCHQPPLLALRPGAGRKQKVSESAVIMEKANHQVA